MHYVGSYKKYIANDYINRAFYVLMSNWNKKVINNYYISYMTTHKIDKKF